MEVIRAVVDDFYARVRHDAALGPVFAAHIEDWEPHLKKMYAFWGTVLVGRGEYKGNPFEKHQALPELSARHFEHWLDLFAKTLEAHCSAPDKAAWEATARRMGFAMAARLGFGEHAEWLA